MAIRVVRNQPIQTQFNKNFSCDTYELMQLVQPSDFQKVQFVCTPHKIPTTLSGGVWATTGLIGNASNILTAIGAGTASKASGVGAWKRYQIQFDIKFLAIDNTGGYRVKINNQWLALPDASNGNYSILSGPITCYITMSNSITDPNIIFETAGAGTGLTIKNITIGELSSVAMSVLDENLQQITNVGQVYTQYIPNSGIATVNIIWSDLYNAGVTGLCYLYFYDAMNYGNNLLVNPTFTGGLTGWTAYQWGYDNSLGWGATYDGTGSTYANELYQEVIVPGGAKYRLTFTMYGSRVFVTPSINGAVQASTQYTSLGTAVKTHEIDLSAYSGYVSLRVAFMPVLPTYVIRLSTISLVRFFDAVTVSNIFDLQPRHPNTLLIKGKCNQAAFGFDFSNFDMSIRVHGHVLYKEYPDTTDVYNFSNEVGKILEADAEKLYEVTIRAAPEYHHDTIRLMRQCDTFSINNNVLLKQGNYEVKPTYDLPITEAQFLVRNWQGLEDNSYSIGRLSYAEPGYVVEGYW